MGRHALNGLRAQRGLAMVEFAITVPLLLLLLFAIGEFGRMLFQYNSLLQANRDASRYVAGKAWNPTLGAVELSDQLKGEAKNLAVYGLPVVPSGTQPLVSGLTTADVQVTAVGTTHVQVSTTYTFVPILGSSLPAFVGNAIALNFPLVATTVMRAL
ncbi:TadE/TadG family type IV pilus assembly protein [Pseudomonas sp. CR3202]|uniref:TadE/TadG family type IV pilus assembly protein n=1 Tax=Pseudomonas sp. CR3202 TaxID=3351532 RepID=UPI003BEFC871